MCDRSTTDLEKNLSVLTSCVLDNNILDTESKKQSNHHTERQELLLILVAVLLVLFYFIYKYKLNKACTEWHTCKDAQNVTGSKMTKSGLTWSQ